MPFLLTRKYLFPILFSARNESYQRAPEKLNVKRAWGCLFEVKHWLRRAYKRKLLSETEINSLRKLIEGLTPKLSAPACLA